MRACRAAQLHALTPRHSVALVESQQRCLRTSDRHVGVRSGLSGCAASVEGRRAVRRRAAAKGRAAVSLMPKTHSAVAQPAFHTPRNICIGNAIMTIEPGDAKERLSQSTTEGLPPDLASAEVLKGTLVSCTLRMAAQESYLAERTILRHAHAKARKGLKQRLQRCPTTVS